MSSRWCGTTNTTATTIAVGVGGGGGVGVGVGVGVVVEERGAVLNDSQKPTKVQALVRPENLQGLIGQEH